MEKVKYYTPTIEEFHVGATFEYLRNGTWYEDITNDLFECHDIWKDHEAERHPVRVKYLDREDIESLGFEKSDIKVISWVNKDYIGIQLWNGEVIIYTKFGMFDREEQVFKGKLKNKSELKRVLKQIGYEF